jgi:hypothetical protein
MCYCCINNVHVRLDVQAQLALSRAESALDQYLQHQRRVVFRGLPGSDNVKFATKVGASGKRLIEVCALRSTHGGSRVPMHSFNPPPPQPVG